MIFLESRTKPKILYNMLILSFTILHTFIQIKSLGLKQILIACQAFVSSNPVYEDDVHPASAN